MTELNKVCPDCGRPWNERPGPQCRLFAHATATHDPRPPAQQVGEDGYSKLLIDDRRFWQIYLHSNQYYLGRLYIWSKRPGLVDLMDITREERDELFDIGKEAKAQLSNIFNPDLFNWASLGNESRQCHVHLIPRYEKPRMFRGVTFTDENYGKNYAPYNTNFAVRDEVLQSIRAILQSKIFQY